MAERPREEDDSPSLGSHDEKRARLDIEKGDHNIQSDQPSYQPLQTRRTQQTPGSLSKVSSHRSHNGYGVDEPHPEHDDAEAQRDTRSTETDKDPYEVSFEGDDADPWCPRSLPLWRKWTIVLITSFGSFCVTCASSIYVLTYGQMIPEFHTTQLICTLGLSTFVLGIALGPVWSPLSEYIGRKPVYLISFAMFTIWIIPAAVAQNIETVIVARFFQGFTGSAFLSVAGGTVGDLFTPRTMHNPMTIFTIAPFVGPAAGPLIGGFINSFANWRWTHYVLIIWAFCLFLALAFLVPETYHPVVLKKKAKHKRKETGDDRWKAPIEKQDRSFSKAMGHALLRPFQILIFEPMALCLDLYSALLLGILYLFFGAFPLVFETNHGFNLWQVGCSFLGLFVGNVAAALMNPVWVRLRSKAIEKNGGKPEPEFRLYSLMLGCLLVPIGLFWFGFSTYSFVSWVVPIIGSAIFAAGTLLAFNGVFTFLVETYGQYAASALAANAFLRCIFAAVFPLFGDYMYDRLGYQWASALLAFLAVAMIPFPFVFFKYGKRIRSRSRMATSK